MLVRIIPLATLLRLLKPNKGNRPYRNIAPQRIADLVNANLRSPRNMKRRICLRKGLLLFHFLRLGGAPAVLHIALHPTSIDPKRLHAHCWVTVKGKAFCENPIAHTNPILSYGQT